MASKRFYVTGRVQGVFFRASTCETARGLGLDGYARNLADGRVEVYAAGPRDALSELETWLWQGPPEAHVEQVEVEDGGEPVRKGFRIS